MYIVFETDVWTLVSVVVYLLDICPLFTMQHKDSSVCIKSIIHTPLRSVICVCRILRVMNKEQEQM